MTDGILRQDILKNLIDIEEFNSARANVIYNQIMSRFIFSNLKSLLYNAASEKIQKDKEHLINNKNIIEKCHSSSFVRAFFKKKFSLKYVRSCIKECSNGSRGTSSETLGQIQREDRQYQAPS